MRVQQADLTNGEILFYETISPAIISDADYLARYNLSILGLKCAACALSSTLCFPGTILKPLNHSSNQSQVALKGNPSAMISGQCGYQECADNPLRSYDL